MVPEDDAFSRWDKIHPVFQFFCGNNGFIVQVEYFLSQKFTVGIIGKNISRKG
jgi:hypothetical protein